MTAPTTLNVKDGLELIVAVAAVVGIVYKISQVERAIYEAIDAVKDASNERLHQIESRLDVYLQKASDRREHEDYMFNALDKKMDHKFRRLLRHQRDIENYLTKKLDFRVREYFGAEGETKEEDSGELR